MKADEELFYIALEEIDGRNKPQAWLVISLKDFIANIVLI